MPNPATPKTNLRPRSTALRARAPHLAALLALASVVGGPAAAQGRVADQSGGALLVLAASSLTDVLPAIGRRWEAGGGAPVRFSFDATSRLAPQAVSGVPADVFVSADEAWISWLRERGRIRPGSERIVAGNRLVFVVPRGGPVPDSPEGLRSMARIAVAGENVPAGRYAREALTRAGVLPGISDRLVTGGSVRGVLEWVARGEVDGGVVYGSDAQAEPEVRTAFALDPGRPIRYWAAVLASSARPSESFGFLDFLGSDEARAELLAAGFADEARTGDEVRTNADPVQPLTPTEASLPSVASAIRLSLLVGLFATFGGLLPAIALGWLLARHDFRGKTLVSTLVLAPLVLPPVVTGFLMLSLLGRQGALGSLLASVGLSVPFTLLGATLAALVVGMPLYILSVRGAFEAVDPLYEELSWTLGVPPRNTFLRVSLPLALPGIAAGAVLAFARALGEFGATVVLAGNVEGGTRTIALAVYTLLEAPGGREAIWLLVGASVLLSLAALAGYEALSRRQRQRVRDDHGR